jgi:hypothetical protein|tara:strand:- start:130 stop:834 length:705 start_codon:yes stop_codon:yes gene_type:complete
MKDDLVEPSDAERATWADATRDYVMALEAEVSRARDADLKSEPAADVGYKQAWQEIADLLDIPAQAVSPREVHEQQIMPRLRAALAAPQQGEAVGLVKAMRPYLDAAHAGIDTSEERIAIKMRADAFLSRTPTEPEGMVEALRRYRNALERITNVGTEPYDGIDAAKIARAAIQGTTRDDQAAVLAERERCAQIAEKMQYSACLGLDAEMESANAQAVEIAAAIRNQSDQAKGD